MQHGFGISQTPAVAPVGASTPSLSDNERKVMGHLAQADRVFMSQDATNTQSLLSILRNATGNTNLLIEISTFENEKDGQKHTSPPYTTIKIPGRKTIYVIEQVTGERHHHNVPALFDLVVYLGGRPLIIYLPVESSRSIKASALGRFTLIRFPSTEDLTTYVQTGAFAGDDAIEYVYSISQNQEFYKNGVKFREVYNAERQSRDAEKAERKAAKASTKPPKKAREPREEKEPRQKREPGNDNNRNNRNHRNARNQQQQPQQNGGGHQSWAIPGEHNDNRRHHKQNNQQQQAQPDQLGSLIQQQQMMQQQMMQQQAMMFAMMQGQNK